MKILIISLAPCLSITEKSFYAAGQLILVSGMESACRSPGNEGRHDGRALRETKEEAGAELKNVCPFMLLDVPFASGTYLFPLGT